MASVLLVALVLISLVFPNHAFSNQSFMSSRDRNQDDFVGPRQSTAIFPLWNRIQTRLVFSFEKLAFLKACYFGDLETVQKLFVGWEEEISNDSSMQKSLYLAILSRNVSVVNYLMINGVALYPSILIDAISKGKEMSASVMTQWSLRQTQPVIPNLIRSVIELWNGHFSGEVSVKQLKNMHWKLAVLRAGILSSKPPKKFIPIVHAQLKHPFYFREEIVRNLIYDAIEGNRVGLAKIMFARFVELRKRCWCRQYSHFIYRSLGWKRFTMVSFFFKNIPEKCATKIAVDVFLDVAELLRLKQLPRLTKIQPVVKILLELFQEKLSQFTSFKLAKKLLNLGRLLPPAALNIPKDESCSICLEPFRNSDDQEVASSKIVQTCPKHYFHRKCLSDFFKQKRKKTSGLCPLCRNEVIIPDEEEIDYPWPKPAHQIPFDFTSMQRIGSYFLKTNE